MTIGLSTWASYAMPHRRAIYMLARIFVVAFLAVFVFQLAHLTRTQEFHGPFGRAADGAAEYVVPIGTSTPFLSIPSPPSNEQLRRGAPPSLWLWVNGRSWNPPEAPEPSIVQGKLIGIRGLYRVLHFSLPGGTANDASTSLKVRYEVRAHSTVYDLLFYSALLLTTLSVGLAHRARDEGWMRFAATWHARALPFMQAVSWILIVACCLYAGTVVYGAASGDALPTATALRLIPAPRLVSMLAPFAPLAMLAFACAGAASAWTAWLGLAADGPVRAFEQAQTRLWRISGLPVLLCLFLFVLSSGAWSGFPRAIDHDYMGLASLVPHSDAGGYFNDTFNLAYFGQWGMMGSRRPMAEALRQLVAVVGGYSVANMLLVQLALMVMMLYLATCVVVRWYGIWAGIGFAALVFNIARPYLGTTLTEPLGIICGLFSLIYFVQSVRRHSLAHALVGLAGLTVALWMRMGDLFAVPFLVLWVGYAFAKGFTRRIGLVAAACGVVIAVLAVNTALGRHYGAGGVDTGDNFAWVTCGLSMGTPWEGCEKLYKADLDKLPNERARAAFLYAKTWENFIAHPAVSIRQVEDNLKKFFSELGQFLFAGYTRLYTWDNDYVFLLILLAGIWCNRAALSSTERSFWVALLASIPASAALFLSNDGWRALVVTHVFVAAFLAIGLVAPGVVLDGRKASSPLRWQTGAGVLAAFLAVLLVVPALAQVLARSDMRAHPPIPAPQPGEAIVSGGRRVSGFLVIADGTPRPRSVPALHLSEFATMIRMSHVEEDFGPFVDDVRPRVPFAFVSAGRMDEPGRVDIYVAPPQILERRDVWAWRLKLRTDEPGGKPWMILQDVAALEPLP